MSIFSVRPEVDDGVFIQAVARILRCAVCTRGLKRRMQDITRTAVHMALKIALQEVEERVEVAVVAASCAAEFGP
jgi:hypothetical protein